MDKKALLPYVSVALDDTGAERNPAEAPDNARLVAWQCGFEPMAVLVWSYLGVRLDGEEAADLAKDYRAEKGWFADEPTDPNFVF